MPAPRLDSLDRQVETTHFQPLYRTRITAHTNGDDLAARHKLDRDVLSLSFEQTIGAPAASWAITLPPQRKITGPGRLRKWNEVISPMDYVEIDMRRLATDPWTTVMRGFVDNCFEADVIDQASGVPSRRCVINGRNFGKLWLEDKIFYLLEIGQGIPSGGAGAINSILDRYWGITASSFTPGEFLDAVWKNIARPKLDFRRTLNPSIAPPTVACTVPNEYRIYSRDASIQTFQGPLWNLMQAYANQPYTEFLVRDLPGARQSSIEWRWAPMLTRGNKLALPDHGKMPKINTVHARLIGSYNVGTGDNDRYTYFWAAPGQASGALGTNINRKDNPGFIDGNGINLYGYKDFQPTFNMYAYVPPEDQAAEPTRIQSGWGAQLNRLTGWLVDSYIWAIEMHEGSVGMALDPEIVVGEYLDIPEEGRRFYVEGVRHEIVPGQYAQTQLTVSRGLPLGDTSVERPVGYDPKSDAPIPGGSIKKGPVPSALPPNSFPPNIVPFAAQGRVVAEAALLYEAKLPYRLGTRAYMDGINAKDRGVGMLEIKRAGIDCSEFVDWCYYFATGVRMPPTAHNQYNRMNRIARADLLPGDAVFFERTTAPNFGETITHAGIYIGGGQMVNAQNEDDGIRVTDIDNSYWGPKFVAGGRLNIAARSGSSSGR